MKTDREERVAAFPSFTFLAGDHLNRRMDAQRTAPGMRSGTSQVIQWVEASYYGPVERSYLSAGVGGRGGTLSDEK